MQTKMERAVRMTAQLYEARDAARRLLDDRYPAKVAEACTIIKAAANDHGGSEVRAATALAREAGGFTAVLLLAAVVELAEPTVTPNRG